MGAARGGIFLGWPPRGSRRRCLGLGACWTFRGLSAPSPCVRGGAWPATPSKQEGSQVAQQSLVRVSAAGLEPVIYKWRTNDLLFQKQTCRLQHVTAACY